MFFSYLRGLIDSDGWITKNHIGLSSSSKSFLEEIKSVLEDKFNISTQKVAEKKSHWGNVCTLILGKNSSVKLGNLLYGNAEVFLKRKYDNFLILKNSLRIVTNIWERNDGRSKKYVVELRINKKKSIKSFYTKSEAEEYKNYILN